MSGIRLTPGARLWNGAIVTPQMAAAYNSASERIERFEAQGRRAPDNLLNGRHNIIAGARP